jgi:hypothetical protein
MHLMKWLGWKSIIRYSSTPHIYCLQIMLSHDFSLQIVRNPNTVTPSRTQPVSAFGSF